MVERTFKFETEEDAESFISSVVNSFNSGGKDKSVWANTVDREGNTVIFTRQLAEPDAIATAAPDADLSESSAASSPATTETEPSNAEELTKGVGSKRGR